MTVEPALGGIERRPFLDQLRGARFGAGLQTGNDGQLLHDFSFSVDAVACVSRRTGMRSTGTCACSRAARTTGARPGASSCDQPSAIRSASSSSVASEDLLVAAADAGFQPDVFHSDRTVPGNELTGPLPCLVLGLIVESGQRSLVEDVKGDDVELGILRELEYLGRGERGGERALERHDDAPEHVRSLDVGRDDHQGPGKLGQL